MQIKVIHAQDDRVTRTKGLPPEQIIEIDGTIYRCRHPDVIAQLFSGSEEEDTDWDNVATEEWLQAINDCVEWDEDVREGLLRAMCNEYPLLRRLLQVDGVQPNAADIE
jgi:hypothetical protein